MPGSKLSQTNRPLAVVPPGAFGPDDFALVGFTVEERLSQLFAYELTLVAEADTKVDFKDLLGQPVTVEVGLPESPAENPREKKQTFNGICIRCSEGGVDGRYRGYSVSLAPKIWLLSKTARSRIFQQKSVPDILKEVLTGFDVDWRIKGTFDKRDYCVQYRESDLDFASRLMEEEGIYYYFAQAPGSHKMVVANAPDGHDDLPGGKDLLQHDVEGQPLGRGVIMSWEKSQELASAKYLLKDHCFEMPKTKIEADKDIQPSVAAGPATYSLKAGNDGTLVYEYPGEVAQRYDGVDPGGGDRAADLAKIAPDIKRTVAIRMQEEAAAALVNRGSGSLCHLMAGYRFTRQLQKEGAPTPLGDFVLTSVGLGAKLDADPGQGAGAMTADCHFECIPAALPYRPARLTERPFIRGSQTAVVVGPSGEEIFCDKYGRVKVQFHWDREGKSDTHSSCWIRVASHWAGKQWGDVHIPRVGMEVIVDFLEGDPDQPIIVGCVYNADNMPPYKLPDKKNISGIKSDSTQGGGGYNEFIFDDTKGKELVRFHAQLDQEDTVENDRKTVIEKGNDSLVIKKGDRTEEISKGNDSLVIKQGDRTEELTQGNDSLLIKQGNRAAELKMGNDSLKLGMGNLTTKLDLGKVEMEAMQSIELKVGQSSIKIDQMGVTITGMMIKIEGQVQVDVKGLMVGVNADAMLNLKGAVTMIG